MCSLFSLSVFTPDIDAQAESQGFGPRAGSTISGTADAYGQISKRPYRRRQTPKFDYRMEAAAAPDAETLASYDHSVYLNESEIQPASFCDCVGGCNCGSSIEPGCGCEESYEPGCGCDDYCEPACGCDDVGCSSFPSCGNGSLWSAGFEWTFVKPRYSQNVAYTTMESDGATTASFTDTEFDYDLELSPRVWVEAAINESWSWRASWWQFDHAPSLASTSPNANGFGEITHPAFGDVDISTTIPTDTFTASSNLNAYTVDVEALKQGRISGWQLGVSGGVRYASTDQTYFAQLRDTGNTLRGQIDYTHEIEGVGPTISLAASRPLMNRVRLACAARGSLLFGDGSSRLEAGEDLDLANPFTTIAVTNRDDLLPIGEARVGLEWVGPRRRGNGFQWFLTSAMEGQIWGNAGSATSEAGDLGFFGFNVGAGFLR